MKMLSNKWNGLDQTLRNRLLSLIGVIVIVVFCLFATVCWPRISGKPELVLNGESEVTIAAGSDFTDEGATATLLGKSVDDRIYETGEVDTSVPGTYELDYNVDGRWQTYTVTRTVIVEDETAPEITLNGEETVTVEKIEDYAEPGAVAADNCDGDVSAEIAISELSQVNDYTYQVTYTASDAAGNRSTVVRNIVIQDNVAPEITLNGDAEITIQQQEEFTDPGATASDDRDGDLTASIVCTGYVDIYRSGDYTLTYTVTDAGGNQAQVTRNVTVEKVKNETGSVIYLTFDDGPSEDVTAQILDILAANNVKATFFICDYDDSTLPLLKRMISEGHTIGIHGYSHDYEKIYANTDVFMENVHSLMEKLKNDTGYEATWIRFPGGSSNTVSAKYCEGVMTVLAQKVTDEGLQYMDWNVSSTDAAGNHVPSGTIVSAVESELKTGRENVVLMHDTSAKQTTADALQEIIDYGKANGYSFSAITEDTVPVHHAIQN